MIPLLCVSIPFQCNFSFILVSLCTYFPHLLCNFTSNFLSMLFHSLNSDMYDIEFYIFISSRKFNTSSLMGWRYVVCLIIFCDICSVCLICNYVLSHRQLSVTNWQQDWKAGVILVCLHIIWWPEKYRCASYMVLMNDCLAFMLK